MFICKYCGTELLEHQPHCPSCGAPIKVSESRAKKTDPSSIREICIKYDGTPRLYLDDAIDPKRMATVRSEFKIPANETLIVVYDDTVFGSNKAGFAVCAGGLYWKNDWAVETKRNYLSWTDFAKRYIELTGYHIDLGRGDVIGVAGAGDDKVREQIANMLKEIKQVFSE